MTETLQMALSRHGINIVPDGSEKQREGSQWLFYDDAEKEAFFGDFKSAIEGSWVGKEATTPEEKKAATKRKQQRLKQKEELQKLIWCDAQLAAEKFWNEECTDRAAPTPYLVRKKIDKLFGTRVHINDYGSHVLIVPIRDVDGKLWSYQRIFPEKLSAGDKFLLEGGRKEGCFFLFGNIHPEGKVYVCEGFATAASVYMAFGETQAVVAAIDSGNLGAVSSELRKKYPACKIILCADNDAFTVINGVPTNVGLAKARCAAADCQGEVVFPRFADHLLDRKGTDFNDLHVWQGLESVREQIEHPEKFKPEGEIEPIICKGKPSEDSIAFVVTSLFKNRLMREGNDLFLYNGTHWELMGPAQLANLRNLIRATSPGKLTSRDTESAFKTIRDRVPHIPGGLSFYTPNPLVANFRNGSLHASRKPDFTYETHFKAHDSHDFITSCLPFDYLPESSEVNQEFEDMLKRLWPNDTDQQAKIDRYGEDLGRCLMSLFPGISIYLGKPGTGKSTLLLLASRLVAEQNLCSVDPTAFEGFNMETMPGKLVNIVTDINTHKPITDELVKMIVDRVKFRVRRKGIADIYAYIPATHLWGANKMPKSFEGESGAMGRRVTVVATDTFQPEGNYKLDFAAWVWEQGPQGIINFAVRGLLRLLARGGHLTKPESNDAKMELWKLQSDPVGRFLYELRDGQLTDKNAPVLLDPKGKIERKHLFELYSDWCKADSGKPQSVGKIGFFDRIEKSGFKVITSNGIRYFSGIQVGTGQSAEF